MDKKNILQKLDRAKNLPTLPTIALKVNEMLKDYDVSVDQLTAVIEKDQAIVLKLLKLVNSAFYGLKGKVNSIPHAITLLGYNTLRNAVISVSIIDAFKVKSQIDGFDLKHFWVHSIEVAVISKYLAEKSCLHAPEEAFTCGLLHDIGKLVQLINLPDIFEAVFSKATAENIPYYDAEMELSTMNHAHIGAYLADKWSLPQDMVDVLKYHHRLRKESSNHNRMVVVHAADLVVNTIHASGKIGDQLRTLDCRTKTTLLGALKSMPDWYPKAKIEIETACRFFMEE